MKKLTKKELKKIQIQKTEKGFTIWIVSWSKKHNRHIKHWVVDCSLFLDNGEVNFLSRENDLDYEYEMVKTKNFFSENCFQLMRNPEKSKNKNDKKTKK